MRTPAKIVSGTIRDSKAIPRLVVLTLILVQMVDGRIVDFNLVALTSEAAAIRQLTEMVNAGGIYKGPSGLDSLRTSVWEEIEERR
jgi:hypothetical protein